MRTKLISHCQKLKKKHFCISDFFVFNISKDGPCHDKNNEQLCWRLHYYRGELLVFVSEKLILFVNGHIAREMLYCRLLRQKCKKLLKKR